MDLMQPVMLSAEQVEMIETVKKCAAQFDNDPRLIGQPAVIEQARTVLNAAVELKLPVQAFIGLQHYVSMYDNDARLPPHLRTDWSNFKVK